MCVLGLLDQKAETSETENDNPIELKTKNSGVIRNCQEIVRVGRMMAG